MTVVHWLGGKQRELTSISLRPKIKPQISAGEKE
jgi:hypothetical protein